MNSSAFYRMVRAGFALLSFGFNLMIFVAVAEPSWVTPSGRSDLAWIWISALVMGGTVAVMCAVET